MNSASISQVILLAGGAIFTYLWLLNKLAPSKSASRRHAEDGLRLEYPATENMTDSKQSAGERPIMAVIFVHGLGADPARTWHHGDVCWITDLLPKDLERKDLQSSVRLFTFNYDSFWVRDSNSTRLTVTAESLRRAITNGQLPHNLVLVGHSYGGLIIKQASWKHLEERHVTEPVQALVDMLELKSQIKGVLFLGTPHRGTPFTRFGIIAASFLTPLDADVEIMRPLMPDSVYLDDLEKKFIEHFHSTRRIYYFERHKMRRYILGFLPWVREFVVPEQSATLGAASSQRVALGTDHRGLNKFRDNRDSNYQQIAHDLLSILSENAHVLPKGDHTHWTVTRLLNPLFTGREDILQELDKTVRDAVYHCTPQSQCRIVITGMGGQGKSEICLQLADRLRQMFWGVFWIDVSMTSVAEKAFLDLAHKLGRPVQTWDKARLEIANLKYTWLMILDNADDPSVDYHEYIPSGPLGVILLTSRNEDCQLYASTKLITLEGLSDEDARELLLKAARVPPDQHNELEEDAQRVASLLQSHPLALIQAGTYMSRSHCNLAGYPQVYEQQRQRLLVFRPKQARSRYGDVYTTFEASVDILKTSGTEVAQDALQLLSLLAVCGSSRLPLPLFEAGWCGAQSVPVDMDDNTEDNDVLILTPWHIAHLPSLVDITGDEWDSYRLVEAVQLLKAFSLVSTDSQNNHLSVSMHPLIHAWARDRQEKDKKHKSWLQMGCLMAMGSSDRMVWKKHERQLQPHIEALVEWDIDVMFAEEPTVMVARILGNFKDGVLILERVVKIQEQTLAEDHPSRLASQYALAGAYEANGQVKEAVALLERVVKIEEQTLAEDHPDQLASQHALAGAYEANGQVKEAVVLLERVVKIQEQTLAEDHPSQLASQHTLAGAYEANGQVKEAVALLERVVKIKEQTLAEDHPSRLASQHALAGAYEANGQVKEAVALLERVVKIKEQTLTEDHPSRLASQHALAGAYEANGQVKEAVALLERVVKIQEQTLAEDHPSRLASQHNLAIYLWKLGSHDTALSMMTHVVEIPPAAAVPNCNHDSNSNQGNHHCHPQYMPEHLEAGVHQHRPPKRATMRHYDAHDTEDSEDEYKGDPNEDTANTLEELLGLVKELKATVDQQSKAIKEAQTDTLSGLVPSTRSWASIAAGRSGQGTRQPTLNNAATGADNLARHLPYLTAITDTLYCAIDTSRVAEEDTEKISPGAIRAVVEKEIRVMNGQDNWRCRAVTRDTKNTRRIKITCRDETEQYMVKQVAETKIAPGTRVLRDKLYLIKVDSVNRLAVLDEHGEIRSGAAESFGRENETSVAKLSWLSKRDEPKAYGSMVVYLTKGSDAQRLLREGFFHVAGESGYTGVFEQRPRPEQCFNCQELGHKAYQCKNAQKCARCAGGGHRHSEYTETILKCHHKWTKMVPSSWREGRWPIRSMLWINKEVEAEQVQIESPDMTAAVVRLPDRLILVVSVYVPGRDPQALRETYDRLREVVRDVRRDAGDDVSLERQGEADQIVDLMSDFALSSLLRRGTKTWQGGEYETTIDLVLASEELMAATVKCTIYKTEHGSDHRPIETVFDKEINARIAKTLHARPGEGSVQEKTDRLMSSVLEAVHALTPKTRPSPYAKRWWTTDLTQLRRIYTYWRNRARSERRAGHIDLGLEETAKAAAKQYHDAIRQQKKKHWNEFLADNDNI
ncbi:hypothetical protein DV736_g3719, partial [Chaetothyriales sp. CBS 134916]